MKRSLLIALAVVAASTAVARGRPSRIMELVSEAKTMAALEALGAESRAQASAPRPAEAPANAAKISIEFHGPLREALRKIASASGINLIATGNLDESAEVMLKDVSAEEALAIVATSYHLKVTRQGSIWTLRPMTADEQREASSIVQPPAPATPAAPPAPPTPGFDPDSFRERMQQRFQEHVGEKLRKKLERNEHDENDLTGFGSLTVAEDDEVHDAVSYGGGVTVLGHVTGDAVAFGGPIHLGPDSVVDGDVLALGGPVDREDGAEVRGEVIAFGSPSVGRGIAAAIKHGAPMDRHVEETHSKHREHSSSSGIPGFLAKFAVLFGLGSLTMLFAPDRMRLVEAEIKRDPVRCGVTGILGGLALIPLTLLLAITITGLPVVAFVEAPLLVVGVVMGLAAVASEIGLRIPLRNLRKTQAVVLAVGLLILLLVGLVPVVGPLVMIAIGCLSLGAIIRTRFGSRRQGIPEPV